MPRRSVSTETVREQLFNNIMGTIPVTEITIPTFKKCGLVSDKLKNDYYEMNTKELECPICYENICCKNCFSLTNCGNVFHLGCFIKCTTGCPICRS